MRNAVGKGKLLHYYRRGRSQYRDFSPVIVKESLMMKIGMRLLGFSYKVAVGGVGYVLGGLAITADAPKVLETEKCIAEMHKSLDLREKLLQEYYPKRRD